mgnify:CR=1 FL=1|jgi:hypothetical protein|tara:strand:+ start:220 stop:513 length:294 start_codon:yes stop_codon:yes gene_type:complete
MKGQLYQAHGHGLLKEFAVGDLVQWNRWHNVHDKWTGSYTDLWRHTKKSHVGIITRIYQSATQCWCADVQFTKAVLYPIDVDSVWSTIPLGCLVKLS